jgi:predicted nucleic-acid-binding protein
VTIAIDTNVLVRLLVRDDEAQHMAVERLVAAFNALLERAYVEFEHPPTVEEALYVWAHNPEADFADCLLTACTAHLGGTTETKNPSRINDLGLFLRRPGKAWNRVTCSIITSQSAAEPAFMRVLPR